MSAEFVENDFVVCLHRCAWLHTSLATIQTETQNGKIMAGVPADWMDIKDSLRNAQKNCCDVLAIELGLGALL
jgi:hypothetical protein